jgi:hypothetical protein
MWAAFIAALAVIAAYVVYSLKATRRPRGTFFEAPRPRGIMGLLVGNLVDVMAEENKLDHLIEWSRSTSNENPVYYRLGLLRQLLIVHPEDIRHVLVANQRNYVKGVHYERISMFTGPGLSTHYAAALGLSRIWRRSPAPHRGHNHGQKISPAPRAPSLRGLVSTWWPTLTSSLSTSSRRQHSVARTTQRRSPLWRRSSGRH